MNPAERRATLTLASVYGLRMLGMFLILPVFVLYARDLPGATPALIGLALGIYGLTQGLLQIPFGWLSDKVGRKPVIALGLTLFAAGSMVAASAPDMVWTVIGRAIQGAGAVAAVLAALLADLTRDGVRTRAMAVVGVTIGASFGLSLVLGPVLDAWVGVRGIFWLTAVMALGAIAVVWWGVPESGLRGQRAAPTGGAANGSLWHLHLGIFTLHAVLTAMFVAVPQVLAELITRAHSWVYLPVLLVSVAFMVPAVLVADRPKWQRPLQLGAVAMLTVSFILMGGLSGTLWGLAVALVVFFTAFNFLEASLPAAVSRAAPGASRGTALGVYSSSQFLGTFVGGLLGGLLWGIGGPTAVFLGSAVLAAIWFGVWAHK